MKTEDVRGFYEYSSGKVSELVRQLGFAGIAVIWLFKVDAHGSPKISADLVLPLTLIVGALALDFLQYAVASVVWASFNRLKEYQAVGADEEFLAPRWINWPALFCFWVKTALLAVAYFFLLRSLLTILV